MRGAISIVTNTPALGSTTGYLEGGYGTYDATHLQGALEFTPLDGVFGVRIVANYDRSDATFRNVQPGRPDANGGESYSGRIALRLDPSERVRIDLKAYGGRNDLRQSPFQPTATNTFTGYSRAGLSPNEVDLDHPGFRKDNAWGFLARGRFEASDELTLNLLTSYDGGSFSVDNDGDGTPADLLRYAPNSSTRQFNQEARATYSKGDVDLVVGGYFGTDTNRTRNLYTLFGFQQALGRPADPTGATGGFTIDQRFKQFRQSTAIFSQLDVKLSDHLAATAGLRYTWDKARFEDALSYFGGYKFEPLFYSVTDPANPGQPVRLRQAHDADRAGGRLRGPAGRRHVRAGSAEDRRRPSSLGQNV